MNIQSQEYLLILKISGLNVHEKLSYLIIILEELITHLSIILGQANKNSFKHKKDQKKI